MLGFATVVLCGIGAMSLAMRFLSGYAWADEGFFGLCFFAGCGLCLYVIFVSGGRQVKRERPL